MKKFILHTLLLSLLSISTQAQDFYVGAEYSRLDIASLSGVDSFFLSSGVRFNDWLSLEGRVGKSNKIDDEDQVEIESILGVYTKLSARNNKSSISPYILLGYARTSVDIIDEDGDDLSGSTSDFSYGLWMDFDVSQNFYIDIDYINYLDKNGADITAYSLGLNYKF